MWAFVNHMNVSNIAPYLHAVILFDYFLSPSLYVSLVCLFVFSLIYAIVFLRRNTGHVIEIIRSVKVYISSPPFHPLFLLDKFAID